MIDQYITKFEYEKSASAILDEDIRDLTYRLNERNQTRPPKQVREEKAAHTAKLQQRTAYLEHQLDIALSKVNKAATFNRKLRDEIDTMRINSLTENGEISKLTSQVSLMAELKLQETLTTARGIGETQRLVKRTTMLRSKSTNQRLQFNEKIVTLTVRTRQNDIKHDYTDSQLVPSLSLPGPRHRSKTENFEPIVVLRRLKTRQEGVVREAKVAVDGFVRRIKLFQSALEQIKKATGMWDIDEIVTTLIKSEEQNHALSRYITNLHQEIESLQLHSKKTRLAIESRSKSVVNFEETVLKNRTELGRSVVKEAKRLQKLKGKAELVEVSLKGAEDIVIELQRYFEGHDFRAKLPTYMEDEPDSTSLLLRLSKLESSIDEIVLFHAYKKDPESPSLKLVTSMTNKLWNIRTEPGREIVKLNEMLETQDDPLDRPLLLDQLRLKAAEKIKQIPKASADQVFSFALKKPILLARTPTISK
jgi:hypothetical protein